MTAQVLVVLDCPDFDVEQARRLAGTIAGHPEVPMCLDFSAVRRVEVRALGLLASSLGTRHGPVTIKGLSHHETRILEYLGARFGR